MNVGTFMFEACDSADHVQAHPGLGVEIDRCPKMIGRSTESIPDPRFVDADRIRLPILSDKCVCVFLFCFCSFFLSYFL